jgi:hypothetical protein
MEAERLNQPHHGARFELVHSSLDETSAHYQVNIYFPLATYKLELRIGTEKGECVATPLSRLPETAPAPEQWALQHLHALARQVFRAAQSDGVWQRRLMRWRAPPTTSGGG